MLPFLLVLCVSQWLLLLSAAFNVAHLPGFMHQGSLPFHLETGYVEVDEIHGVELFYYFIESERNPREDPILLWLSGGPGCTALSAVALEIGPLKIRSERYNGSLPNLVYNPYTWTKFSNIIFLDSPVGTGFSFSNHPLGYETGDKSWSKHATIFLRKWFADQQQFLANPLYIAGDSYAGKVVPVIVHEILNENDLKLHPKLNIQGIGENCKGEDYESLKNALCASLIQVFNEFMSELMLGNILEPKCKLAAPNPKYIAASTGRSILQESNKALSRPPIPEVKCGTYASYLIYIWANNAEVQDALNVKKGKVKEWLRCNEDLNFTEDISSSLKYHVNVTTRGCRALVYSGDHDMIIPMVGTIQWIKSLQFFVTQQWRSWRVSGQVVGYTESYSNNLTFATVKGAGHTAPESKGAQCLAMFGRWVSKKPL